MTGFLPRYLQDEIFGSLNAKEAGLELLVVKDWPDLKGAEYC